MRTASRPRRTTAAALTAVVAVSGGLSLAAALPALASPITPQVTGTSGSIVVMKYQNTDPGAAGNGTQRTVSGDPLPGVHFQACPVLGSTTHSFPTEEPAPTPTDAEWWMAATEIVADFAAAPTINTLELPAAANCYDGTTNADGRIVFGDGVTEVDTSYQHGGSNIEDPRVGLPLGLYVIQEIAPPSSVITPMAPYLVTLPLLGPGTCSLGSGYPDQTSCESASGTWTRDWIPLVAGTDPGNGDYIAWTYPKNSTVTVDLRANTSATYSFASAPIDYTITAPIPSIVNSSGSPDISTLVIEDALSAGFTAIDPQYLEVALNNSPLSLGTHYLVSNVGMGFRITFTSAGLALVNASDVGDLITVSFAASLSNTWPSSICNLNNQPYDVDCVLRNTAQATWNTNVATDEVETNLGGITLHALDSGSTPLVGAIFQISTTSGGAVLPNFTIDNSGAVVANDGSVTTGAAGTAAFLGLRYYTPTDPNSPAPDCYLTPPDEASTATRWVFHGGPIPSHLPPDARAGTTYWVEQTDVPAGFEVDATPRPICITGPLASGNTDSYDDYYFGNEWYDVGIQLPYSGQTSKFIAPIIGFMLTGAACAGYVIWTNKARAANRAHASKHKGQAATKKVHASAATGLAKCG